MPARTTLARVRALADPLRYRVFEELAAEPRTARQMAERLDTPPTRLYHHFRVLEQAGLIEPAGTRQKRGTTEKYFRAAVDRVEIQARPGEEVGGAAAAALLEAVLGAPSAGSGIRPRPAGPSMYVKRLRLRVSSARADEVRARLEKLASWCERQPSSSGTVDLEVTLACAATSPPRSQRKRAR